MEMTETKECELSHKKEEALELQDSRQCDQFRAEKFQREAKKHWDLFYKRNETRFFKDRHWTIREFQELSEADHGDQGRRVLLEVGCGVGNFAFPLLEETSSWFIYACDLSPRAIEMVQQNHNCQSDDVSG